MEVSFSRGFSHGWLQGCDHKALVPGQSSAKRGVLSGPGRGVSKGRALVELAAAVQRGDGVVFEGDRPENARQGGRVYGVFRQGRPLDEPVADGLVELSFGRGDVELGATAAGAESVEDRRSAVDPAAAKDLYGRRNRGVACRWT